MLEKNKGHITSSAPHCSVLLDEVLEHISLKDNGRYLEKKMIIFVLGDMHNSNHNKTHFS